MGTFRTLVFLACFAATIAPADGSTRNVQLETFATCAGRLSALMEYQWIHDTASADTTARHRTAMLALIGAIMPPDADRDTLILRVNAKAAFAHLLRRTRGHADPVDARWATQRATRLLRDCTSMLL